MPAAPRDTKTLRVPIWVEMLFGGVASLIATTLVHPLDVLKVRIQVAKHNWSSISMARTITRCEGYGAMYAGLTAAMLRQAAHTSSRFGVYSVLYYHCVQERGRKPTISERLCLGTYASTLGGFVGTPPEIALVRMMADGPTDPSCTFKYPKRYKNAMNALATIRREEGFRALWRGAVLTMVRGIMTGLSLLYTYDQVRQKLLKGAEGLDSHLVASVTASFVASVLTLPVDTVKTIYQEDKNIARPSQVLHNILKKQGVIYLWQGFMPYFGRVSIHIFSTFLLIDHFNDLFFLYATDWRIFRKEKADCKNDKSKCWDKK